jgi:hypothetical protein
MALTKTIDTKFGIKVKDCYLRVEHVSISKDNMSFYLRKYAAIDKPFFDEDVITCTYSMIDKNPYIQAYEYLKTLDEYSDAVDC